MLDLMNRKWYALFSQIRETQYIAVKAGSKYIRDVSEKVLYPDALGSFLRLDKNVPKILWSVKKQEHGY